MARFELESLHQPAGDQPRAIAELSQGLARGDRFQTLLGATGTGKTFSIAHTIANHGRPTLVMSHNKTLAAQLYGELKALFPDHDPNAEPRPPTTLEKLAEKLRVSGRGVRIQGMENLMVRYSQCCQPVPGDEVIGYITRGRGVSIHRVDCPNVLNLADHPERRVEIEWEAESGERFFVRLEMEGSDRRGLVADIASTITQANTNIKSVNIQAEELGMRGEFVVEVENLDHLKRVVNAVKRVKGVISVERREHFGELGGD